MESALVGITVRKESINDSKVLADGTIVSPEGYSYKKPDNLAGVRPYKTRAVHRRHD